MKLRRYHDIRSTIADGDLLLFRRRGLISVYGRGIHSHAAKAIWWRESLFCCEVREWYGGRAVLLSREVKRRPGRIDLFRVNPDYRWPEYDRDSAAAYMRRLAGCKYGYWGVCKVALLHLPFVRLFYRPSLDDTLDGLQPPFCSQACATADRLGGHVDPVCDLPDNLTEPADLARSPFYAYDCTLVS